jgi:hypothetical protein
MTARDGVVLRADVYRPDGPGRFPVLLSRLPYDKNGRRRPGDIDVFVEHGYVVIMQDTRGRFASGGGEYEPLVWEAQDGHDAVEWAAQLPMPTGTWARWASPISGPPSTCSRPRGRRICGRRSPPRRPPTSTSAGRITRAAHSSSGGRSLRDPHGAGHDRAPGAHGDAPARARARARPGADAVGAAARARGVPAPAPHGLGRAARAGGEVSRRLPPASEDGAPGGPSTSSGGTRRSPCPCTT